VDVERLVLTEGVDIGHVGVREQEHVGLLDLLESAYRRSVETEALGELVLGQFVGRDGEVLSHAGQIGEPNIDDLDTLVLDQLHNLRWGPLDHLSSSPTRVARALADL